MPGNPICGCHPIQSSSPQGVPWNVHQRIRLSSRARLEAKWLSPLRHNRSSPPAAIRPPLGQAYKGREFRFILALQFDAGVTPYTFTFRITNVEVQTG